jgi:uncharacterized protein DUF6172
MKKTFSLTHPKIKVPRLVEAIKFEVKKYIKRERNKPLPEDVDFWDFDCRYGADEASSEVIHVAAITEFIDQAETKKLESFYLEILSKPGRRTKKPKGEPQAKVENDKLEKE